MNLEYFIAKRIIDKKSYKSSISAPIIKIGIVAIALGVIVMLIAIATGIGFQQKIRDKVVAFNGHVIVTKYQTNNSQESEWPISTNQDFYPDFKEVPEVIHIQGTATKAGVIRLENDFEYVVLKGVGADYDWKYFKEYLVDGELPDFTGKRNQQILISQELANKQDFKVGDTFNTYFLKKDSNRPPSIISYTITGIYNSGLKELDELYMFGDIRHIQRLNKWKRDEVGLFEMEIEDYNKLQDVKLKVFKAVPSELDAVSVTDKFPNIFQWIKLFDNNVYGIIGIMILVAGINMITALLVLILERTKMIGILKALGASSFSIRKIFLINASYLIVVGLFWGNLIGLTLLFTQKYFNLFPLDPEVYQVSTVPVYITVAHVALVNIGTFVLCLLMLLLPSYIVTKISPVKAINFD